MFVCITLMLYICIRQLEVIITTTLKNKDMIPFEAKAERKAENILRNYDYCLVTPLKIINEFGDAMPKEPVRCTDIDEIRHLFETEDDVMIETPDGCNY